MKIPKGYNGPVFSSVKKLSLDFVTELISFFQEDGILPYKYARDIVRAATLKLDTQPNIFDIPMPQRGRLMVCGDTHGQFEDLLTIFRHNGFPSEYNVYLFNGDYVDRGTRGVEILLVLYSLLLVNNQVIFLTRGNHETRHMNLKYGFEDEVLSKYDMDMFEDFSRSFMALPLGAIIEKKIICLHGGLPLHAANLLTIEHMQEINRRVERVKDKMLEGILWSDPRDICGVQKNSRGSGVFWGKDVTSSFLQRNGLELLVRSHEKKQHGFELTHDDCCITIFSASNYCETNDNMGAFLILSRQQWDKGNFRPEFHSYRAVGHDFDPDRLLRQTKDVIRERIFGAKHDLLYCFTHIDVGNKGMLTVEEWAHAMTSVLNLPLPWAKLAHHFTLVEDDNLIDYRHFLARYQLSNCLVDKQFEMRMFQILCDSTAQKNNLEEVSETVQVMGGPQKTLSFTQFVQVMEWFDLGLTKEQIFSFMETQQRAKQNVVRVDDFLKNFSQAYENYWNNPKSNHLLDLHVSLQEIRKILRKDSLLPQEAFLQFKVYDSHYVNDSQKLSFEGFAQSLLRLGLFFTEPEAMTIAKYMDRSNNGYISVQDFSNELNSGLGPNFSEWQHDVVQTTRLAFYESQVHLKALFRYMDEDNCGGLTVEEFAVGIQAFLDKKKILISLSQEQIKELFDIVDVSKKGKISYEDFRRAFYVKDLFSADRASNASPTNSDTDTSPKDPDNFVPHSPISKVLLQSHLSNGSSPLPPPPHVSYLSSHPLNHKTNNNENNNNNNNNNTTTYRASPLSQNNYNNNNNINNNNSNGNANS